MQVLRIFTLATLVAVCWCEDATPNTSTAAPATTADPAKATPTSGDAAGTNRTRRSDVIGLFNSKLHKKFSLLGSLSSLSSSNPHIPATAPDCSHTLTYDHKAFSLWSFKKAIFSTLLQAIKAITGGVIALKGQIIKVKGHLIAAKGHLLQTKGEAISDFGRHIATKALLTPVHVPPSATGLSASGIGSTGYAVHKPIYGPPSASGPSTGYGAPPKPVYGPPPSLTYGPPPAKVPPSSYGPPPAPSSSYGAPSGPSAPPPSPPTSSYGAPPPAVPSTSYGVPVASAPAPSGGDYSGPPPPSSSGPSNLYLPPSFPSSSGFSAPSTGYGAPFKRDLKLPDGVQAGLLVLKPIKVPATSLARLDPRNRVRKYALFPANAQLPTV